MLKARGANMETSQTGAHLGLSHGIDSPHAELAVLARALHRTGWDEYIAGHITYRQPDDTLLTLPCELGWEEVTAADILRIDEDGQKLEGEGSVRPTIALHTEFHKARPGVNVTVHQHPRFATVWSACGRIPPVYDQLSAAASTDDIVFYDDFEGPVVGSNARAAIDGIGDATMALLRNHGAFVVGDSIPQAFTRCTALEARCQRAWHVEAIGGALEMPRSGEEAITRSITAWGGALPLLWEWAARRELRADPAIVSKGADW
jgi:L-fuculose-phosphate aldolase